MASVRKEVTIDAPPEAVWGALRDWGALHRRLVPGFVTDARVDGEARVVTFFNGVVLRELIVDVDEDARRLAWSIADGPYEHHSASSQVFDEGGGRSRFVWVADLLPHELEGPTSEMMERGIQTIKVTLDGH